MQTRTRVALIVVLVICLAGLAIHYGGAYEDNWPYPDAEQVAEDPEAYDGERILFIGQVETVEDGDTITYRPDADLEWVLEVTNFDKHVEPGGTVHVYGELQADGTVHAADSIVVVNEAPSDQRYKLVTSALGGLLAAGLFLRYWRIDWRNLAFRERERHG